MKYKEETIREIANSSLSGLVSYLDKSTGEVIDFPEELDLSFGEENPWQESIDKIEENPENYIRIGQMDPARAFMVMEGFVEQVELHPLKEDLQDALERRKPFRNFRDIVEVSPLRIEWFDFRLAQNMEWVREMIALEEDTE